MGREGVGVSEGVGRGGCVRGAGCGGVGVREEWWGGEGWVGERGRVGRGWKGWV